jgi:hypothetical protein
VVLTSNLSSTLAPSVISVSRKRNGIRDLTAMVVLLLPFNAVSLKKRGFLLIVFAGFRLLSLPLQYHLIKDIGIK